MVEWLHMHNTIVDQAIIIALGVSFFFFGRWVGKLYVEREHYRAVNELNAEYAYRLKVMLDCWYFKRPRSAASARSRYVSEEAARKILDEVYNSKKQSSGMVN